MLQEIKNLPSRVQEYWLEHNASILAREIGLRARYVYQTFQIKYQSLTLTYLEHQLLLNLLAIEVTKQDPKALTKPRLMEKVSSHFTEKGVQIRAEMGFSEEDKILANLIYSPLFDIARLWVRSYQDIAIIEQEMNVDPPDVLKIGDIVKETRNQSENLVKDMRKLERIYHPLQSQLTFRPKVI